MCRGPSHIVEAVGDQFIVVPPSYEFPRQAHGRVEQMAEFQKFLSAQSENEAHPMRSGEVSSAPDEAQGAKRTQDEEIDDLTREISRLRLKINAGRDRAKVNWKREAEKIKVKENYTGAYQNYTEVNQNYTEITENYTDAVIRAADLIIATSEQIEELKRVLDEV